MSSKANITNLEELDAAQKQLRRELDIKKQAIESRFDAAKDFYAPSKLATNLASDLVGEIVPLLDWKPLAISFIQALKKKL